MPTDTERVALCLLLWRHTVDRPRWTTVSAPSKSLGVLLVIIVDA